MNRNPKNKEILNASLTETETFSGKLSTSQVNVKNEVINRIEFVVPWQFTAEQEKEEKSNIRIPIFKTDIVQYYF